MIKNKKILITGGSSGLGSELISELLNHNNKIYHLGRFIEKKKNLKRVICNLENIKNIKKKLKILVDTKKIDYVFLNAGILGPIKRITSINVKELEKVFKINFFSNKEILDYLIINKIKTKLIVAISSGAALKPKFGWYPYCSSKSAGQWRLWDALPSTRPSALRDCLTLPRRSLSNSRAGPTAWQILWAIMASVLGHIYSCL